MRRIALVVVVLFIAAFTVTPSAAHTGTIYTEAELQAVKDSLDADPAAVIPNTAWGVDLDSNQVVVTYFDVSADGLAALQSATSRYGDAVRLEHLPGSIGPGASTVGGNAVVGDGVTCSLGFNTIRSGVYFFITAGHCTDKSNIWRDNDSVTRLGYRTNSYYGTDGRQDYGIVRYDNASVTKYGMVDNYNGTYQDISGSRPAKPNEPVCHSGARSAKRCGHITSLCHTVNYIDGKQLTCMIRTDACGGRGDSGGPLYSGSAALGIYSGQRIRSGDHADGCALFPNGPTYYSHVHGILVNHGLTAF